MPGVRVLFLDHSSALGGGEIALLNLLRHLNREIVDPVVILGAEGPLMEKISRFAETHILTLSSRVSNARKDSLGLSSLFRIREMGSLLAYVWHLARFIKQHQIDVVHANSLKSDIIGGLAGRLSSRPVIWHVRDRIEDDYLPGSVVRIFRALCRVIPRYVIANSLATHRTLRLGTVQPNHSALLNEQRNGRSIVVHDGTDLVGSLDKRKENQDFPRIGLIGRISPWKGQHIFLQAAARAREHFPRAKFLIIGSALFGEEKYEKEIRQLSASLGLEGVVQFTGFCADVKEAITELDLVVHASTIGEPFGQVIIEGMAAGKPVIATNGGGVPEIVENGNTGFLVPMGDAVSMAEAICLVLADPVLARTMGDRGHKRVMDHFTLDKTARKIESVYQAIVAN